MKTLSALLLQPDLTISAAFYGAMAILKDVSVLELDAEALILELERSVNTQLPPDVVAKVLAGVTVYATDIIYKDLPAFIGFCNLASDSTPAAADVFDPADAYEVAWGRIEIAIIDPEQDEKLVTDKRNPFMRKSSQMETTKMRFDPEILKYTGLVLTQEGAVRPIFSLPDAMVLPLDDGGDPLFLEAAMSRHKFVEKSIAEYVYKNAEILLDQLAMIPTPDKQPLVTREIREGLLKSLKLDD